MKNLKQNFFSILGIILSCLFFATVPVVFIAAEGWRKPGAIPIICFGIIFLIYSIKKNKIVTDIACN